MAGTLSFADLYGKGDNTAAAPALIGIDGVQPGAVAPASGSMTPTAAPAYAWAGLLGLLVLLRYAWQRGH